MHFCCCGQFEYLVHGEIRSRILMNYFGTFFMRFNFLNLNHSLISARSSFINPAPTPARMPNATSGTVIFHIRLEDSDNNDPISPW
jgi:hypothetical protein